MKKAFFFSVLIVAAIALWAEQQPFDVLTLNDGSRFSGILTEYTPAETLTLQALDGRQLTFPIEQIESVAQQPSSTPLAARYIEVVFLKDGVIVSWADRGAGPRALDSFADLQRAAFAFRN